MTTAVIAGYARTPFHFAHKGALVGVRPDDMAAAVLRALVDRTGVKPEDIEDVIMGCAYPEGEQGNNVGRIALHPHLDCIELVGLPDIGQVRRRNALAVQLRDQCGHVIQRQPPLRRRQLEIAFDRLQAAG